MKFLGKSILVGGLVSVLSGCVSLSGGVDRDLSLPAAKEYTQSMEREIVEAIPSALVQSVDQMKTGTFFRCTAGRGYQWAGGLTAETPSGIDPAELLDPIEKHFASRQDVTVTRRIDDEDSLLDVAAHHDSFWILRYDPEQAEIRLVSFSPCVLLPADVWPGDEY